MKTPTTDASELITDNLKLHIGKQFLAALKEKDWDLLRTIITDDITWTLPGNSLISGRVTGAEAVIKRAKIIVSFGVSLKLNYYLIALNGVALSLHNQASRNGLQLDEYIAMVCTLKGDKISVINSCISDVPGVNTFFTLKNMDLRDAVDAPTPSVVSPTNDDIQKSTIASAFTTSLKNNDWEQMRSLMNDEIIWTLPGVSTLSGPANGINAVIKRVQSLKKFGVNFELRHIVYGMHGFVLLLHNTAQRGELILDEYVAIVFDLKDGKIQYMTTHLSDVEGINTFFIPGIIG